VNDQTRERAAEVRALWVRGRRRARGLFARLFARLFAPLVRRDERALPRGVDERRSAVLALSAISAEISSSLDEAQVVERALQQVIPLTGAAWAAVYVVERDRLRLAGASPATDAPTPAELPLNESAPARAIAERAPVLAPQSPGGAEASVPLLARGEALGALHVGFAAPRRFEGVEVALLESVARQLAVALDNARLHTQERQQRRLAEVLRAVANIVASQPLDDALRASLLQLRELLAFDRAAMLLIAEPGVLRIAAQLGFADVPPEGLDDVRIDVARYPHLRALLDERVDQTVADTELDPIWQPSEPRYRSWIGVPLVTRERVLGCLSIGCFAPNCLDVDALQLARTFADQVVIAVENADLFAGEQRRRLHAEQLQQASYRMVTSQDLDGALRAMLEGLAQSVAFDRAHLATVDHAAGTWTFRTSYPTSSPVPLNRPLPLSEFPLAARVVADQRPLLAPDTSAEPAWIPERYGERRVRCWAGVPLIVRGTVLGVLNVDGYRPHTFGEEDVQILQGFSNQAAAVFENFRLLEGAGRQNRALAALNNILAASNEALTHENLVVVALERVLAALDLKGGVIHRLEPVARELRLWASSGVPKAVARSLERLPAAGEPSALQLPAVRAGGEVYRFFSVPLVSHGQNLGLLSLRERPRAPLGPEMHDLLRRLGQQLGVVLDNAVLFDTTVRRVGLSNDLGRLSLAISAHLNQDAVLELICRESISIFDVQGAYVWLLQGEKLVGAAACGPGSEGFRGHSIALGDSRLLPAQVIADWRPRYVNHVDETGALPPDLLALTGARAALAVPLLRADVALGVLLLVHTGQPDAFAAWFTEQIGLLGVQAALALQNAALFDEVRRRFDQLRLVNEVGRYATAILSPAALVEGVARKLYNILHYDLISLLLVEDGELRVNSAYLGAEPLPAEAVMARFAAPHSVASEAVRQAEPVLRNQDCDLFTPEGEPPAPGCALAVPLIIADEVIGALLVERRGHDQITQDDLDVLEPLAAQLAISVSNALLYERVRKQTVELEARVAQRTAEIRQQHERTEAILRSVADAVIVFDLHGEVVLTNPVARELFDRHDLDMNLSTRVEQLITRALKPGDGRAPADRTDIIEVGKVALQAKAARVVEGDVVLGSVVVLRDISRLKEVDRMKDQFVSNVSHELRTPLANLKVYLSLLEQGRPERRANYLEVMAREVARLERLIEDLLHISRLEDDRRLERARPCAPVQVDRLIETVLSNNAAWAESERRGLRHERLAPTLPPVEADEDQLVRALTNLIANAINYTAPGGQITVRSGVEPPEQAAPDWVIIEVADDGIGIPASELGAVFDRFYRGSNVTPNIPGTGLGLAIIKDIVTSHHGTIEVESQTGCGSTFRLRLPVSSRRA